MVAMNLMGIKTQYKGAGELTFELNHEVPSSCPITYQTQVFDDSTISVKGELHIERSTTTEFWNRFSNHFPEGTSHITGTVSDSIDLSCREIHIIKHRTHLQQSVVFSCEGVAKYLDMKHASVTAVVAKQPYQFRYYLSNLLIVGNESAHYKTSDNQDNHGRIILRFTVNGTDCSITTLPEYVNLLAEKPKIGTKARTSFLSFTLSNSLDTQAADGIADDICTMLSLATRNTVVWTAREIRDQTGTLLETHFKTVRLLPYQGQQLVPDEDIAAYLTDCFSQYRKGKATLSLERVIGFMVESVHHPVIDVEFALAFLALIRLVTAKLRGNTSYSFHPKWKLFLDSWKAKTIFFLFQVYLKLDKDKIKMIQNKLDSLNYMTTYDEICAFCDVVKIGHPPKTIVTWRNRLFHSGDQPKKNKKKKWDFDKLKYNHCALFRCTEEALLTILNYKNGICLFWESEFPV